MTKRIIFLFLLLGGLAAGLVLIRQPQLFKKKAAVTASDSTLYFVHSDNLGSPNLVTDSTGSTVSRQAYYPYGSTRSSQGDSPTQRQYTGQISDVDNTGLYYYNARYYHPAIGKFTQADTAGDGLNRYAYVGNNPLNKVDPTGTQACYPWELSCIKEAFLSDWQALQQLALSFSRDPNGMTEQVTIQVLPSLAAYGAAYLIGGEPLAEAADASMCVLYGGGSDCVQAAAMAGPRMGKANNAMPDNMKSWYDNMGLTVEIADEPKILPSGRFAAATTNDIGGNLITFYPDASGNYYFSGQIALHESGHAMAVGGQVPAGYNMLQFYANECVNCRWTVEQLIERGYDPQGSSVMNELAYLNYNVSQYRQAVWDTGGLINANGSFVTQQQLLNIVDSVLTTNRFQPVDIYQQNFRYSLIQVTSAKYSWR